MAGPRINSLHALIFTDHGPELMEPCQFYVYAVVGRPGLVKPGIARDNVARASHPYSRELYGKRLAVLQLPTRRDALLVEGAILRDRRYRRPTDLGWLDRLEGASEVRKTDPDALVAHARTLVGSLANHTGRWQDWALKNVPKLTRVEQVALRRQLVAAPEVVA